MNKALATSISGMGLTGAVLIISVALSFNPPIGIVLKIVTVGSITAFVIFVISTLMLRKRSDEKGE